jgi:hypothetical protein
VSLETVIISHSLLGGDLLPQDLGVVALVDLLLSSSSSAVAVG